MKVKSNEHLFNSVNKTLLEMQETLPAIVQNDQSLTKSEWLDFVEDYEKQIGKLDKWMEEVKKHIRTCQYVK